MQRFVPWAVGAAAVMVAVMGYAFAGSTRMVGPAEDVRGDISVTSFAQPAPTTMENALSAESGKGERIFRNEEFGFALRYVHPISVEPLSPATVFVGPIDPKSKYESVSVRDGYQVTAATSSFRSIAELQENLEKQGRRTQRRMISEIPIIEVASDDESYHGFYFLRNEFVYGITAPQDTHSELPEMIISHMVFFSKHSQSRIVEIIEEEHLPKVYRNTELAFEVTYPGSYSVDILNPDIENFEVRFFEIMGYDGSNLHIKVRGTPFLFDDRTSYGQRGKFRGVVKEVKDGRDVYVLRDTDAAFYEFMIGEKYIVLEDTSAHFGTTRLDQFYAQLVFFPPK